MGATKATVAVTPEAAPPKKIVDTHTKASVRRELFASEPPSALPDEKSQSVHDKWVEENGAKGLIKLRGEGRTVETVRGEMELYALGMKTAAAKAATVEMAPTLAPLLVAPDEKQAALDAWVKENVGEERGGLLKLRGEGRTVATVAAEVALVIAGASAIRDRVEPSALPEEKSQSVHDKWVEENGAKGLIKLRGEGRTVEIVRSEMELYALGMQTATTKVMAAVEAALAPLLVAPDEKQAALDAWVKENVGEERGGLLKLRGEGRTVATVAAEVALVIAGAKYALTREGRDHEPEEQKAKADGDASAGAVSLS